MKPKHLILAILFGVLAGPFFFYGPILAVYALLALFLPSLLPTDAPGSIAALLAIPFSIFGIGAFLTCIIFFGLLVVEPQKTDARSKKLYIAIFVLSAFIGLLGISLSAMHKKNTDTQNSLTLENGFYRVINGTWYTTGKDTGYTFTFSYERSSSDIPGVDKDTSFLHGSLKISDLNNNILCRAAVHATDGPLKSDKDGAYSFTSPCHKEVAIPLFNGFKSNQYLSFDHVQISDDTLVLTHENTVTNQSIILVLKRQP